jgi:futalosine hydrolase
MKVLLVAATAAELPGALPSNVTPLVTGVGMVATAARCAQALSASRYDFAVNVGVCGAFRPELPPGTVVHVIADRLPELGAQDGDAFLTIQELQLLGENEFPYRGGLLVNPAPPTIPVLAQLPQVSGITVNTVHGNAAAIAQVVARFNPDVESMEGAAFMYACLLHGVSFAQVRAVSNSVERRNRGAWKIGEAIQALGRVTGEIVGQA